MKKGRSSKFDYRQYMLTENFEIFYYSDLNFKSVGSHSHDYYEFYFFEEGAVAMEIDSTLYPLRQGDVIIVPPGVSHRAKLTDPDIPYRRFVFWLSRSYCDFLEAQSQDYVYLTKKSAKEKRYVYHFDLLTFNSIRSELFSLLDELHSDRFGKQTQVGLDIRRLLLRLSRLAYEQEQNENRNESRTRYETISSYIDTHLDEPLTLDRIAGEFFLSKYYVAHLFRESTGLSVHQYITKKRLAASCGAIQSGAAVGEAYAACGFQDYSSFYRAFRKEYGLSPSEYRELHRR